MTLAAAPTIAPYQLFPSLSQDEYAALKADIRERGVLVPVEKDEHGNILDGHHRVRAWEELTDEGVALADYQIVIRYGMSESQKRNHVRALNYLRRHMGKEQRLQVFTDMRADGMSLRQIADVTGVDASTVKRSLDSGVANATPDTVTGRDGKQYPAFQSPRVKTPGLVVSNRDAALQPARPFDGVPLDVIEVMTRYSVTDPELIPRLQHACTKQLDTWKTILATGTLDGERPIGRVSPTEFDEYLERAAYEHRAAGALSRGIDPNTGEITSKPHVAHNSGNNEWYTPPAYIDAARAVMGTIDLDPASSDAANETVQAAAYYTIHDNGLEQAWSGNVWMNPPYSGDLVGRFCQRLRDHLADQRVAQAVVLVNNATETAWFQDTARLARAICFPSQRVRYWNSSGVALTPLQGQAVLYFGEHVEAFTRAFSTFGLVVTHASV